MSENIEIHYNNLFNEVLVETAARLADHLKSCLDDVQRVDAVVARAKSPSRFVAKALKEVDGVRKYENPLSQIQDQIGARITVLYLDDVQAVKIAISDYFHAIEWQNKKPESDNEFGYFGEHYILAIPDDVIAQGHESLVPKFFELQIKTLFQHAWSEAHHDIGYKAPRELSSLEKRQMAFSAAQAWGADQIFADLARNLAANDDQSNPAK